MSTNGNRKGKVAQVIGPVVDIEFFTEELPAINSAIKIDDDAKGIHLTVEVAGHMGDRTVRAVAMMGYEVPLSCSVSLGPNVSPRVAPPIENPADSVEAVASIAAAVAAGDLTAAEAALLAKVVDVYVRTLDSRGFNERLSKLEKEISGAPADSADAAVWDDTTV